MASRVVQLAAAAKQKASDAEGKVEASVARALQELCDEVIAVRRIERSSAPQPAILLAPACG